jgi:hypothetical protein
LPQTRPLLSDSKKIEDLNSWSIGCHILAIADGSSSSTTTTTPSKDDRIAGALDALHFARLLPHLAFELLLPSDPFSGLSLCDQFSTWISWIKFEGCLWGKTPGQFIKLPMEERDKVFRHHLVQKDYVQIEKEDNDDF